MKFMKISVHAHDFTPTHSVENLLDNPFTLPTIIGNTALLE